MAKKQLTETLQRKEKVKAAIDLRGVPEGTRGRVMVTIGLTWIRYWVQFDNGVEMGSIHRDNLVRVADWDQFLVDRELAAERAAAAPVAGATSEADTDAGAEQDGGGGGGGVVNGVQIPQLLLDRTKAALERFGVSR